MFLALGTAQVEVRFERNFEVQGHCPEARAFEVEVKLHVLFGRHTRSVDLFKHQLGLSSDWLNFLFGGGGCRLGNVGFLADSFT